MATIFILFAIYYDANGNTSFQQEFNSQGACEYALADGKRARVIDIGYCASKG